MHRVSPRADELEPEAPGILAALGVLVRGRWWILSGLVLGVALAGLYSFTRRPTYRATAEILLDQDRPGGLFGDLAAVASLASAPTATSEIEILTSRSLAGQVVRSPQPTGVARPGVAGYDESLGLTTLVHDERITPLAVLERQLLHQAPPGQPAVLPDGRLFARCEPDDRTPGPDDDRPSLVRVEVLAPDRVALSGAGLAVRLGLVPARREERAWTPGTPLSYRGLSLDLESEGEVVGGSFLVERMPDWRAIGKLLARTSVHETARGSGVVAVTVVDTDGWRAADTANALCTRYLQELSRRTSERASGTIDYVRGLLDQEEQRFHDALDAVHAVHVERPETIQLESAAETIVDQLVDLEKSGTQLDLARASLTDVVEALERGDSSAFGRLDAAVGAGLAVDPLTQGLFSSIAELEGQRATLAARFASGAAPRAQVEKALADLEGRVRAQLGSTLQGVEAELDRVHSEQARLHRSLAELPDLEAKLAEPLLVLRAHEDILPTLLKSLQTAEIASSTASLSAQVIDPAVPPSELYEPKTAFHLVAGASVGLVLSALFVLLADPRRGRVRDAAELERITGRPVLAALPRASASGGEAGYRALAAALFPDDAGGRVLGVTSTAAREGRARTALGIARALARAGRTARVVELDLAHPHLAALAGCEAAPGVAELLRGELTLPADAAALAAPAPGEPAVVPAGTTTEGDLDRAQGAALTALLRRWTDAGEALVLLLPPATDGLVARLGPRLDGLLLVHRVGALPRARVVAGLDALASRGLAVDGLALTGARRGDAR